jgi:hypothetical protein
MESNTTHVKNTHWPSTIILVILMIGLLFFLGVTFITSILSVFNLIEGASHPANTMIVAFSTGIEFVILLVCTWFVLQKTMGKESAAVPVKFPFASWQLIVIPVIVLVAISIGAVVAFYANSYLSWFILPVATLLVVVLPIFLYIGLGSNGIEAGPRWRVWGTVGLGLTIGPLLMIVIEVLVLLLVLVLFTVFLSFQPEKLQELQSFFQLLDQQTDQEVILNMLAPYLSDPRVIAALLGYIALFVPLVEELLKPLAVWLFAKSIAKPSQGFVLGMLSGGAFALVESLNASSESSEAWPFAVGVRAGTSLLHIVLSGIMGYAIVRAFREKTLGHLAATYLAVVSIHGIWNACAIGLALSASGETLGKPEWLTTFLPASIAGILVLGMGIFVVLIASNRKVRSELAPAPILVPAEDKE